MRHWLFLVVGVVALPARLAAEESVDYLRDIKPVLRERCFACHGALKQQSRLRLDSVALLRKGGRHGPAIRPGHAEDSLLIQRITADEDAARMPPQGKPLSREQI